MHVVAINASGFVIGANFEAMVNVKALKGPTEVKTIEGPVEGRTAVNRWITNPVPINPSKEMDVNFPPTLRVAFDSTTPIVGGEHVVAVLASIHEYILTHVLPPLSGFLN